MALSTIHNPVNELTPIAFNVTAGSNVTIIVNASFRVGKVVFLSVRFKSTTTLASGATVFTVPSGYRPAVSVGYMAISTYPSLLSTALGTDGKMVIGSNFAANAEYRCMIQYCIA